MGKFDGILLASDLDGTILTTDKRITAETVRAIEYFEREGGLFSYVTGRAPLALPPVLEQYRPKIPVGCLNGGGIYDLDAQRYIEVTLLPREVLTLVREVEALFPNVGAEFYTMTTNYFYRPNEVIEELCRFERLPRNYVTDLNATEDLCKLLFAVSAEGMPALMAFFEAHPAYNRYTMMRTTDEYYEVIPKGCSKGLSLLHLADHLGVDRRRTIAVGDNANDVSMIQAAGVGVAVANASDLAKDAADLVLDVTNDEHAIARIVELLDRGELSV